MILDDGGDATLLVHKGVEFEKAGAVPDPPTADSEEFARRPRRCCSASLAEDPQQLDARSPTGIKGVTEETTTGVHRLYQMRRAGDAAVPGDQRQRLGHQVEVRQPLRLPPLADRRHQPRAPTCMIGGKVAVVCGYGDVGKGCAESLRGQGARVIVTEIDPICALQAAMEGYQVAHARGRRRDAPTSSSPRPATRTSSPPTHMARMKHQAIVGNIGHFDNEIDMAGLGEDRRASSAINDQAAGRRVGLPRRPRDHRARPRAAC